MSPDVRLELHYFTSSFSSAGKRRSCPESRQLTDVTFHSYSEPLFLSKDNSLVLTLQYSKTELKASPQTEMPQLPLTQWRDRAVPRVSISSEILSFSEE